MSRKIDRSPGRPLHRYPHLKGEILDRRNEPQGKSQEHLGKAIEIFQECGADGWAKNYEEELSAL